MLLKTACNWAKRALQWLDAIVGIDKESVGPTPVTPREYVPGALTARRWCGGMKKGAVAFDRSLAQPAYPSLATGFGVRPLLGLAKTFHLARLPSDSS